MTPAVKLEPSWLASLALHALLLAAMLLLPRPHPFKVPAEVAVPIELVPPAPEPAKVPSPSQPEAPVAPPSDEAATSPEPEASASQGPAMIKARSFYAAKVLADPRSRGGRQALATFAPDERAIQICNIEAMEQIHRWKAELRPDLVTPYATRDLKIEGGSIRAEGGAFRAGRRWYGVTFNCEVAGGAVAAFEFNVGEEIPEAMWAEYNLAADDPAD